MATVNPAPTRYNFNFYRFIGPKDQRTTELVRDYSQADGMRGLVTQDQRHIELATQRVQAWAMSEGLPINVREPFPSEKYPGKVWLEFRFGGITL